MPHSSAASISARLLRFYSSVVAFFVYAILGATLLSFPVCLVVHCAKYPEIFSVRELIWMLPAAFLLLFIIFLAKAMTRMPNRRIVPAMVLLECVIALVMIVSFDTQPCSDYAGIWKAANEMARGTFTDGLDPTAYMYYFNWQLGISAFESLFIRAGADFLFFKLLNAALLMAVQYIIFRLTLSRFGKVPACYAYALSVLYLPWCLSIPQFTNHHIGLIFLLFSLILLNRQGFGAWMAAGLLTGVLNVLRPLGILVVLSALCLALVSLTSQKRAKPLVLFLVFLASYLLTLALFDRLFVAVGYTDAPVSQARLPYFKFQKGLYAYITPADDLKAYQFDYSAYNGAMKEELLHRVFSSPLETLIFVANKMVRYLGLFDYQFEMTYNHDVGFYTAYPVKALYCISWFQYIAIVVFSIRGYRKVRERFPLDIYQIFFIGNTLVYLFIEAFSSYRFESYPFLLILAALGLASPSEKAGRSIRSS